MDADVFVFTFKDGALSALAHDLKLKVGRVELEASEESVTATLDAGSLKVVCARKDGHDNPGSLLKLLHAEIEKNLVKDVLESAKFPKVSFTSTRVTATEIVGQLTLHGVTKEIRCKRSPDGTVEARLDQRDFRIKPYSAAFGTMKVKPEVIVTAKLLSPASPR